MNLSVTYHVEKGIADNVPAPWVFKAAKERRNLLPVRPIPGRVKGFKNKVMKNMEVES